MGKTGTEKPCPCSRRTCTVHSHSQVSAVCTFQTTQTRTPLCFRFVLTDLYIETFQTTKCFIATSLNYAAFVHAQWVACIRAANAKLVVPLELSNAILVTSRLGQHALSIYTCNRRHRAAGTNPTPVTALHAPGVLILLG